MARCEQKAGGEAEMVFLLKDGTGMSHLMNTCLVLTVYFTNTNPYNSYSLSFLHVTDEETEAQKG